MGNENNSDKKTKEEILEEINDLQKRIEEKNEMKKERMYFIHMLSVYMSSKILLFISFFIVICFSIFLSFFGISFNSFILGVLLFFCTMLFNFIFALLKSSKNNEIKESFRKFSKRLAIELLFLIVIFSIFIIFKGGF